MKKLVQQVKTETGITLKLYIDIISNDYVLKIEYGKTEKEFKGSLDEIHKNVKMHFIGSLRNLKDNLEISTLEEMLKRS